MALKPFHFFALSLLAMPLPAVAEGVAIGVVAPKAGKLAILGDQVRNGATAAAGLAKDTVVPVADSCTAGDGAAIADALVTAKVGAAIGFLCAETLEEALPKLKEAGIPAITIGVRSGVLMEDALKNAWPLFRLAPSQSAEIEALADLIGTAWSAEPFALVDDGAVGNRDLLENLRAALEQKGVKPVLADTLHPGQDQQLTLVRHLTSAGISRVFIAADRDDVAVVANDLKNAASPISILAGALIETTPGTVPMPAGVQALVLKDASGLPTNADLVKALRARAIEPEGYVFPAIAAISVAGEAVSAAKGEKKPVIEILTGRAFDTPAGPVRFDPKHELSENPYEIRQWDGAGFVATVKP